MGGGFFKMKKQAKQLQEQMAKMKEELKNKIFEGRSVNDLVILKINGENELIEITIKPQCVDKNDVEGLQDLIKQAFQDAQKKLEKETPDMDLPFHGLF
jgi:nucleoid-associated protein EbfC